jgi:Bacterial regulatory proteins, luxR family
LKYFSSSIKNKKLSDFQQFDTKLTKFEDRLAYVRELIKGENSETHEFFQEYFSDYYNVSPNQTGFLAEQDAVCRTIEGLGTYLLNSKDIKSNRKIEYRFWKSIREYNQYKESKNVNMSTLESNKEDSSVEVVDMFYSVSDKNYKKTKDQKVFKSDIEEIEEIEVLQELINKSKDESFIKLIEKRIDEILPLVKDESDKNRLIKIRKNVGKFVSSWASNAKENQVLIKNAIKQPIYFKRLSKELPNTNMLEEVDFYDERVVKKLLPMIGREEDLMSELGIVIYDFNNLLNEIKFSAREQEIIDLLRQGVTQKEIANELSIDKRTVSDTINRIAKKTAKYYVKKLYLITQ